MAEKNFLTRQYGPLPGWAWLGVIGGGLLLAYYLQRRRTEESETYYALSTETEGVGEGVRYMPAPALPTPTTQQTDRPKTNAQWRVAAVACVMAQGIDPVEAHAAIGKFLTGQRLNSQDQGIVSMAIGCAGQPPESVPSVKLAPGPSRTPAPPAPKKAGQTEANVAWVNKTMANTAYRREIGIQEGTAEGGRIQAEAFLALMAYLSGEPLSPVQRRYVDIALKYGRPPDPVIPTRAPGWHMPAVITVER